MSAYPERLIPIIAPSGEYHSRHFSWHYVWHDLLPKSLLIILNASPVLWDDSHSLTEALLTATEFRLSRHGRCDSLWKCYRVTPRRDVWPWESQFTLHANTVDGCRRFYLGNHIAHVATVKSLPGESPLDVAVIVVGSLLFPTLGACQTYGSRIELS